MNEVRWLEKDEVLAIHLKILVCREGSALLSDHLLESALAKPRNLALYATPSLYELGASYAEGISRNHSFENGNKRTAYSAAGAFLAKNGIELAPERDNEHTIAVEALAQGVMSRDSFAKHLESHSREMSTEQKAELRTVRHSSSSWGNLIDAAQRQVDAERSGGTLERGRQGRKDDDDDDGSRGR